MTRQAATTARTELFEAIEELVSGLEDLDGLPPCLGHAVAGPLMRVLSVLDFQHQDGPFDDLAYAARELSDRISHRPSAPGVPDALIQASDRLSQALTTRPYSTLQVRPVREAGVEARAQRSP